MKFFISTPTVALSLGILCGILGGSAAVVHAQNGDASSQVLGASQLAEDLRPVRIPINPTPVAPSSTSLAPPIQQVDQTAIQTAIWQKSVTSATAATVRLKVLDSTGHSFGTGTLVDVRDNRALIVTCGHIFRPSQGQGQIEIDFFQPAFVHTTGQLLVFDLERDLGIVAVDLREFGDHPLPEPLTIAPVAATDLPVRQGMRVFSIGCDHGCEPSVLEGFLSAQNRYQGPANLTASGVPVEGRSGGGLFDGGGRLIGICQAAVPSDNEGLYGAWTTLLEKLDEIQLSDVYRQPQNQSAVLVNHTPNGGSNATAFVADSEVRPVGHTANSTTSGVPPTLLAKFVKSNSSSDYDFPVTPTTRMADVRNMAGNMPSPEPVVQYTGSDSRGSQSAPRHATPPSQRTIGTASAIATSVATAAPIRTAGEMIRGASNGVPSPEFAESPLKSKSSTPSTVATSQQRPEELEIVCIIRPRDRGAGDGDIVVIESPSAELIQTICDAKTR